MEARRQKAYDFLLRNARRHAGDASSSLNIGYAVHFLVCYDHLGHKSFYQVLDKSDLPEPVKTLLDETNDLYFEYLHEED